jgi:cytochrome c6
MNRFFFRAGAGALVIGLLLLSGGGASAESQSGEALFKQNCAACHANGGNVINPQKTLHKKSRDANNIKTADDIVKLMRSPGPGMTKFDAKTVSDKNARMIADYIIKTFP